jgi:hypothetical protein
VKRGGVDQHDTRHYFWYGVNVVWTGSMLESKAGNVAQWVSGRERTGLLPGRHATFTRWQASRKTSRASLEQLISIFAVWISRFRVYICTAWNCNFIWNTTRITKRGYLVSWEIFLRLHNNCKVLTLHTLHEAFVMMPRNFCFSRMFVAVLACECAVLQVA